MTDHTAAAPAAHTNQLSDKYVNAVIQQHGYDSPEAVIARLWQWIGLNGGENSVTLLMYEAHKALSKLRAPVADERVSDDTLWSLAEQIMGGRAIGRERVLRFARAALASAPVAGEAQKPVRWLHTLHYETGDTSEIIDDSPDSPFGTPGVDYSDTYRVTSEPLYAAPQASEAVRDAYERGYRDGLQRGDDHVAGCLV